VEDSIGSLMPENLSPCDPLPPDCQAIPGVVVSAGSGRVGCKAEGEEGSGRFATAGMGRRSPKSGVGIRGPAGENRGAGSGRDARLGVIHHAREDVEIQVRTPPECRCWSELVPVVAR